MAIADNSKLTAWGFAFTVATVIANVLALAYAPLPPAALATGDTSKYASEFATLIAHVTLGILVALNVRHRPA